MSTDGVRNRLGHSSSPASASEIPPDAAGKGGKRSRIASWVSRFADRRSRAAFLLGSPIGVLGGLIGLGGAEFRLPILRGAFGYEPLRAVSLNLAVSLLTLAASLLVRLPQAPAEDVVRLLPTMASLAAGSVAGAAWGSSYAGRLSRERFERLILVLLVGVGLALIAEGFIPFQGGGLPLGGATAVVAAALGVGIGIVSSLLGVAGGELIIPALVFVFGADVKVAGTASVMIGLPTVLVGLVRYRRMGAFRRSDVGDLIVPMGIGSILGAMAGGYLVPWVPAGVLKLVLGVILVISAVRIFRHRPEVRIATTSSAHDSGVLSELLQEFARRTGCRATVLTVGSGNALELLEGGGADIALTHSPLREQSAQSRGAIAQRVPIMTNRYVIVGPSDVGALLADAADASDAMRRVAASGRSFVSRGDGSGTHDRERELWRRASLPEDGGSFVKHTRAGMARSLRLASATRAFALCDRSTFLKLSPQLELEILYEGNGELDNVYSVVLPARPCSDIVLELADFLRSQDARALIQAYRSDVSGEPLFATCS